MDKKNNAFDDIIQARCSEQVSGMVQDWADTAAMFHDALLSNCMDKKLAGSLTETMFNGYMSMVSSAAIVQMGKMASGDGDTAS